MRTLAILLVYAAALAFGTYLTFRPTFESRFARTQTETGDGMLNHLILEHSWLVLTDPGYKGTLFTAPFYYPAPHTILYSEHLLGSAPIYWALRAVTGHESAYIWWQIVCTALNFAAFAVVARWLRLSHLVALVGAFLWAFAVVHMDQIKHSQMIPRFYAPFAAYYAIRFGLEPSLRALHGLCAAVFLQCLACVYTGWFLAVGLMVFAPAVVLLAPNGLRGLWRFVWARKWAVAGVLGLWALLMALQFAPYVYVNLGVSRTYEDCYDLFPTPRAWFAGPPGARWRDTIGEDLVLAPYECWLFSGFAVYGLMLAAAVHLPFMRGAGRPALWPAAVAGLIAAAVWVALTLNDSQKGECLWRVARLIPGGNAIRVVTRVYIVVYLFGVLGGLLWLDAVLARLDGSRAGTVLLTAFLALLVWEQTGVRQHSFDRRDFYPQVDRAADQLRGAEVGYVIPGYTDTQGEPHTGPYGEVFGMWVGVRANVPVLNGYSGRGPTDFPLTNALSDDHIREWLKGKYRGEVRQINPDVPGVRRIIVVE